MTSAGPAAAGPLAGRRIVVTRPPLQAAKLAERLAALGGEAVVCPAMLIGPPADEGPVRDALARLADFDYALFVSANAVEAVIGRQPRWPAALTAIAVGPTTSDALNAGGVTRVLVPASRFDSEGVLAMPELQDVSGKRFVLFRGEGADGETGRDTMRQTLVARGASVEPVTCYRRSRPAAAPGGLLPQWEAGHIDAVVATSTEVLDNFLAMIGATGKALLARTPLFVPHARIAAHATARGLRAVHATAATDAGLIAGLLDHFSKP